MYRNTVVMAADCMVLAAVSIAVDYVLRKKRHAWFATLAQFLRFCCVQTR